MANALYDRARKLLLDSQLNWTTDTIHCCLVEQGVSPNLTSSTASIADIATTNRNYGAAGAAGVALTNKASTAAGAADADDVTFTTVSGTAIGAVVLYKRVSTTDDTQNPAILWLDTATGLPITPNGGDIIITWDNSTNRIFRP